MLVYSVDSIDASLEHGAREFLHQDILNDVSMLSGSTSQLQSPMEVDEIKGELVNLQSDSSNNPRLVELERLLALAIGDGLQL